MTHKKWIHQAFCSMTLAFVSVSSLSLQASSSFLGKLDSLSETYLLPPLIAIYHNEHWIFDPRRYFFYLSSIVLAVVLFLLVRIFDRVSALSRFLVLVFGVSSIAAYPVACLWALWFWRRLSPTWAVCLVAEILVATACGVVYVSFRQSNISGRLGAFLLVVHFFFWAWASNAVGGALEIARLAGASNLTFWMLSLEALLLPLLGFLSALSWGQFVKSSRTVSDTAPSKS